MQQYTELKTIRLSKQQMNTLFIIESRGVNISQFIRIAIKDKIKRDWKTIKEPKNNDICAF
jgi:hypothetical protein